MLASNEKVGFHSKLKQLCFQEPRLVVKPVPSNRSEQKWKSKICNFFKLFWMNAKILVVVSLKQTLLSASFKAFLGI